MKLKQSWIDDEYVKKNKREKIIYIYIKMVLEDEEEGVQAGTVVWRVKKGLAVCIAEIKGVGSVKEEH